jgi:hypothetical protein
VIDNSPAPSRLVNADALGEELKFYPRCPRLQSSRGPARHDISQRTPKVCSGSCVDGARGSRNFLAFSLRSGASHVSGLFARCS